MCEVVLPDPACVGVRGRTAAVARYQRRAVAPRVPRPRQVADTVRVRPVDEPRDVVASRRSTRRRSRRLAEDQRHLRATARRALKQATCRTCSCRTRGPRRPAGPVGRAADAIATPRGRSRSRCRDRDDAASSRLAHHVTACCMPATGMDGCRGRTSPRRAAIQEAVRVDDRLAPRREDHVRVFLERPRKARPERGRVVGIGPAGLVCRLGVPGAAHISESSAYIPYRCRRST